MSQFDAVFGGKNYFECEECGSCAIINEEGKLMRMVMTEMGVPAIYEEEDKGTFINSDGSLRCDCQD